MPAAATAVTAAGEVTATDAASAEVGAAEAAATDAAPAHRSDAGCPLAGAPGSPEAMAAEPNAIPVTVTIVGVRIVVVVGGVRIPIGPIGRAVGARIPGAR